MSLNGLERSKYSTTFLFALLNVIFKIYLSYPFFVQLSGYTKEKLIHRRIQYISEGGIDHE